MQAVKRNIEKYRARLSLLFYEASARTLVLLDLHEWEISFNTYEEHKQPARNKIK